MPTTTPTPTMTATPASGFQLTLIANNGSISANPQKASYQPGEVVELSPVATAGHYFVEWDGDLSGQRPLVRVVMDRSKTVEAHFFNPGPGNIFFAAPGGVPTNSGTVSQPWDLQTALNHPPAVHPGDTIFLMGGTYTGRYISNLVGTDLQPIIVQAYPGAKVRIDGNIPIPTLTINEALLQGVSEQLITVSNPSIVKLGNTFRVDNETIQFYGGPYNGNSFYVARGWDGTAKDAHAPGSIARRIIRGENVLAARGENTWFWDLEIMDSSPTRTTAITGSSPWDITRSDFIATGRRIKLINCVLHDLAQGITSQGGGEDFEAYGNVIFNNGWNAPDRGHGHGIYTQNSTPGIKVFRNNIILPNYSLGAQQYGSGQAYLDRFIWDSNVFAVGRILLGGDNAAHDLTLTNNLSYVASVGLGYGVAPNSGALITDNYFDGLEVKYWTGIELLRNTFFKSEARGTDSHTRFTLVAADAATYDYGTNKMDYSQVYSDRFYGTRNVAFYGPRTVDGATLGEWQALTGYETHGAVYPIKHPSGTRIFFRRNEYDPKIAYVAIYNWNQASSINFDASTILAPGESYTLHQLFDFYGDVTTGTYSAGGISVNMTGRSVAAPIGESAPLWNNLTAEFQLFLLRKTSP